MRFDEFGNLIDGEGKIVMTSAQVKESGYEKLNPVDAAKAHQKELDDARNAAVEEGRKAELKRQTDIRNLCDGLSLDSGFIGELIGDGTSAKAGKTFEDAQSLAIAEHKKTLTAIAPNIQVGADAQDKKRAGMITALMVRANVEKDQKVIIENRQSEFAGMGLQMLVRHVANDAGVKNAYTMDAAAIGSVFTDMLYKRGTYLNSMGANSSDLESVLSTSVGKALLKAWETVETTYQHFTTPGTLGDLKTHEFYKNSEAPDVLKIPEGQAAKLAKLSDKKETTRLEKWGRAWSATEEMIINDDLNAVMMWPEKFGRSIPREINYQFWYTLLTGNGPTLNEDSLSLFNADHNGSRNLAAAGAAVAQATLEAATEAFRLFTIISPDGGRSRTQYARVSPKVLAVGAGQEFVARRYTSNSYRPAATNGEINFFGPNQPTGLVPIVEPLIDSISADSWYLMASPTSIDMAKILTLTGRETPDVTSRLGGAAEVSGIIFQIQHFFKVKFLDWRGFYKNAGA